MSAPRAWLLGLLVVAVAGCQPGPAPKTARGSTQEVGTAPENPGATAPQPDPGASKPRDPGAIAPTDPAIPKRIEASPTFKDPAPPATGGWTKSDVDARGFATRVSQAIAKLERASGEATADVKTPEGAGQFHLKYEFGQNRKFRLTYLKPKLVPEAGILVSNGTLKTRLAETGFEKPVARTQAYADVKLDGKAIVAAFPKEYSRLMFAGVTDGRDLWQPLLANLSPANGFKTVLEKRTLQKEGRTFVNYRIVARRPTAKANVPHMIEIVVDGQRWLPVTVRTHTLDAKGGEWRHQWSCRWRFNQDISDKTFAIRGA